MYDVYSQTHTDEVMSFADAVAIYNEVAEKYNAVMALYDTCDCGNTHSTGSKKRIPLYDPETIPKHQIGTFLNNNGYYRFFWSPGELNQCECVGYDNSNHYREGCGILQVVAGLCKELEDLSLKLHGPLNAYYRNGYVQLYTEAYIDPATGLNTADPNGLGIDVTNNVCADLNDLDPGSSAPLDTSTFLETKVYPVITTVDTEDVESRLTAALSMFNTVADLPKGCSYDDDEISSYAVNYQLSYSITNDITGDDPIGNHTKADYDAILPTIYSDFISIISNDYSNWLQGLTRTLAADILTLEQRYTAANADHLTLTQLVISQETTPKTDLEQIPVYADVPNDLRNKNYAFVYYSLPGMVYSTFIDTNDNSVVCDKVVIKGIRLKVVKLSNPYRSKLYLEGLKYPDTHGSLELFLEHATPYTDTFVQHQQPRKFNSNLQYVSTTYSPLLLTIPPCSSILLTPDDQVSDPITLISTFPTLSYEECSNIPYPASMLPATYGPAVIYEGTAYYGYTATYDPEFYGKHFRFQTYLKLESETQNEE